MGNDNERSTLTFIERRLLQPADFVFTPSDELLFQHTVLCQACLPYRDPGDDVRQWDRKNGFAHLKILAGEAMHPDRRELVAVGLPYGPKPRLIMSHLNAEALRTGNPEVEVGNSLTAFIKRIGLDPNGYTIHRVKDQLARLAASIVRLGVVYEEEHVIRTQTMNMPLVESFELWFQKDDRQRVMWPTTVRLNPTYFESLQRHAVPLHPHALGALSHSAMGLDIYAWLAQRLHRVKPEKPQLVPWQALKDQFGWHYGRMDNFKRVFRDTLRTVRTQYLDARFELNDQGMLLRHSPPPVLWKISPVIRST